MEQEVNNIIEQKNLEMDEEVIAIENENVEWKLIDIWITYFNLL